MVYADANIIIRYIINDDETMANKAQEAINSRTLFVLPEVFAEITYDPIVSFEHSITRMAVATEEEAEKQGGDNRTMGRKYTVHYGLYKACGFVSPHFASSTGFSTEDLDLLWEALTQMFEFDRAAARGLMTTRTNANRVHFLMNVFQNRQEKINLWTLI